MAANIKKLVSILTILLATFCAAKENVAVAGTGTGTGGGFTVELIHRDSPNSPLYNPTISQFQRMSIAFHNSVKRAAVSDPSTASIPVLPDPKGTYLIRLSVGAGASPAVKLAVADTGSDLIWLQCCHPSNIHSCSDEKAPIFNPNTSSTYKPLPCDSKKCTGLPGSHCGGTKNATCLYSATYNDGSYSYGEVATDTFTLDLHPNNPEGPTLHVGNVSDTFTLDLHPNPESLTAPVMNVSETFTLDLHPNPEDPATFVSNVSETILLDLHLYPEGPTTPIRNVWDTFTLDLHPNSKGLTTSVIRNVSGTFTLDLNSNLKSPTTPARNVSGTFTLDLYPNSEGPTTPARNVSFPNIVFGCGYKNQFANNDTEVSGIVGLGSSPYSLINQIGGTRFSYCLVPLSNLNVSSTLHFGHHSAAVHGGPGVVTTPLVLKPPRINYYLTLLGISVGNQTLDFLNDSSSSRTGANKGNIFIDSGTTFSFLPVDLYLKMEEMVKNYIKLEPMKPNPRRFLRLCYKDLGSEDVPIITARFEGGGELKLNPINSFVSIGDRIGCLGFAPTNGVSVFGNVAHTNFLVEYDLEKMVVSFMATDCVKWKYQ